jgi:curli biogenesis system outer membrane secretion channel CsgG
MSRISGIVALIAGTFVLGSTAGLVAAQAPAPAISVVGFVVDSDSRVSLNAAEAMTDKLAVELVESGRFRVLDREWLGPDAVDGQRLPLARVRDAASIAGVDYLIVGKVSKLTQGPRYGTPGPRVQRPFGQPFAGYTMVPSRRVARRVDYLRLSLEIVDTKTGLVLTETSSTCPMPPKAAPLVPPVVLLPVSPVAAAAAAIAHANKRPANLDPGIARALTTTGQVIARWHPPSSANR